MIKVIAKAEIDGVNKSCSFSSKQNRTITIDDLSRVDAFITNALIKGCTVRLFYKITYDNVKNRQVYVSEMSSSTYFVYLNKKDRQLNDIISSINRGVAGNRY